MSNEFWTELKRLVRKAESAAMGNEKLDHVGAYRELLAHVVHHAPDQVYRAAPEMAEALRTLIHTDDLQKAIDQARGALAKAGAR